MEMKVRPENINPVANERIGQTPAPTKGETGLPSFGDLLGGLGKSKEVTPGLGPEAKPASAGTSSDGVKFSNHAVERMMSRGIKMAPEDLQKLNSAVSKAAAKGSKDSLVLMNDSAFIVSVKNKTVVTVMDKNALKENVFTNIDSTIVM